MESKLDGSSNNRVCSNCSKPSTSRCGKCCKVSYCSRDCQQKDWKIHKLNCFPVEIRICPETSRRTLFVTKSIPAGALIWKEKPLVFGCFDSTKYETFQDVTNRIQYCIVCCTQILPGFDARQCQRCARSICSDACAKNADHFRIECPVFRRLKQVDFTYWLGIPPSDFLILLRLMNLKKDKPQFYEDLLKLNQNPDEINLSRFSSGHDELSNSLLQWLNHDKSWADEATEAERITWMKLSGSMSALSAAGIRDFSIQEVYTLLNIMNWNCVDDMSKSFVKWLCTYGSSCQPSCAPNTDWHVDSTKNVHFRALANMTQGDEIRISKESYGIIRATSHRRPLLLKMHQFSCYCERCEDPTELDTYCSAIKCKNTCSGYLLPKFPLAEETPWKCDTCDKEVRKVKEGNCLIAAQRIQMEKGHCLQSVVLELQKLLKQYENVTLHSNNHEIICLKELLTEKIADLIVIPTLRKESVLRGAHGVIQIKNLSKSLFKLAQDLLDSGNFAIGLFTHRRGKILVNQFCAAAQIYKYGNTTDLESLSLTREGIQKIREDAIKILDFVPDQKDMNRMAMMTKVNEKTLDLN